MNGMMGMYGGHGWVSQAPYLNYAVLKFHYLPRWRNDRATLL